MLWCPLRNPSSLPLYFSLNMYRKTGYSNAVTDIHKFGRGPAFTNAFFIQDKWAWWSEKQSSFIPSNIQKGQMVTHVVGNVD